MGQIGDKLVSSHFLRNEVSNEKWKRQKYGAKEKEKCSRVVRCSVIDRSQRKGGFCPYAIVGQYNCQ